MEWVCIMCNCCCLVYNGNHIKTKVNAIKSNRALCLWHDGAPAKPHKLQFYENC